MKIFKIGISIALLLVVMFTVSCKSSKTLQRDNSSKVVNTTKTTVSDYGYKVMQNAQTVQAITAKTKLRIQANGKSVSVNGSLRMMRDDVIQLSLVVFGYEVAKMEFRTDEVLIIDKYHKQYVQVPYKEIDFLNKTNLDFYALQAIFWNELFVPGRKDVATSLSQFTEGRKTGGKVSLQRKGDGDMNYQFVIDALQKELTNTYVMTTDNGETGKFVCDYSDFQKLNGKMFPNCLDMTFAGEGISVQMYVQLSDIKNNKDWSTRTEVSSKYQKVDAKDVLRKLLAQ